MECEFERGNVRKLVFQSLNVWHRRSSLPLRIPFVKVNACRNDSKKTNLFADPICLPLLAMGSACQTSLVQYSFHLLMFDSFLLLPEQRAWPCTSSRFSHFLACDQAIGTWGYSSIRPGRQSGSFPAWLTFLGSSSIYVGSPLSISPASLALESIKFCNEYFLSN